MKYKEVENFIDILKESTKNKKTNWEEISYGKYCYYLNNGQIVIQKKTLSSGNSYYGLTIINSNGKTVFKVCPEGYSEYADLSNEDKLIYEKFESLFEIVHKQIYNLEETLEHMLAEIQEEDDDDELPF